MKNRKREICTSGSVRDEDGQPPHLLGRRNFLHLVAGAAALRQRSVAKAVTSSSLANSDFEVFDSEKGKNEEINLRL